MKISSHFEHSVKALATQHLKFIEDELTKRGVMLMKTEYAIHHPEEGFYLGCCLGLGFWSKLDPVGQPSAATFIAVEEANDRIRLWEENPDYPQEMIPALRFVPAQVQEPGWASIDECIAAGLPGWDPDTTEKQFFAA